LLFGRKFIEFLWRVIGVICCALSLNIVALMCTKSFQNTVAEAQSKPSETRQRFGSLRLCVRDPHQSLFVQAIVTLMCDEEYLSLTFRSLDKRGTMPQWSSRCSVRLNRAATFAND
jgi:hypothetical protein